MRDLDKERELKKAGLVGVGNHDEALTAARCCGLSVAAENEAMFREGWALPPAISGCDDQARAVASEGRFAAPESQIQNAGSWFRNEAGLAAPEEVGSEALAATDCRGSAAAGEEPITKAAKGRELLRATAIAETPLKALARLRREAEERIEQLIALLDDIEGDPDLEDESGEPDLSTLERVSQLVLNGDDREDDDDGEPSLAVPEIPYWPSQERVWRGACRSRFRDEHLEPAFAGPEVHEGRRQETAWMHASPAPSRMR